MKNFSLVTPVNAAPTGIATFAKTDICSDIREIPADIAVIGAPFDLSVTGKSGQRMGPRAIRMASTRFSYKPGGTYDPERDCTFMDANRWKVVDCGDVDYVPGDAIQSFDNLTAAVRLIAEQGVFPVILGGDHSVTYPIVQGLDSIGKFSIVHFDAHLDWSKTCGTQTLFNGSPMRNSATLPYVDKILHLGIRGIGSSGPDDYADARAHGDQIYTPKMIRKTGIEKILEYFEPGEPVFVTFDIDAMDATCAPATGAPMFGGLWYDETVEMLEAVAKRTHVIGMDMVEVCPHLDDNNTSTSYLAARLISDLLGFVMKEREEVQL